MVGMMELDPNFSEFIALLRAHDARFLVVGGYAVGFHGHPRYTADLDVWLLIDADNARAVLAALDECGFGDVGLTVDDFTVADRIVQLGCGSTFSPRSTGSASRKRTSDGWKLILEG